MYREIKGLTIIQSCPVLSNLREYAAVVIIISLKRPTWLCIPERISDQSTSFVSLRLAECGESLNGQRTGIVFFYRSHCFCHEQLFCADTKHKAWCEEQDSRHFLLRRLCACHMTVMALSSSLYRTGSRNCLCLALVSWFHAWCRHSSALQYYLK